MSFYLQGFIYFEVNILKDQILMLIKKLVFNFFRLFFEAGLQHVFYRNSLFFVARISSRECVDAGDKFFHVKWFSQVIIGSRIQSDNTSLGVFLEVSIRIGKVFPDDLSSLQIVIPSF
jgi:hypothetical protein